MPLKHLSQPHPPPVYRGSTVLSSRFEGPHLAQALIALDDELVVLNQPQTLEEVHAVDLKGGEGFGVKEGKEVPEEVVVGRAEAVEGQGEGGCRYQVLG